MYKLSSKIKEKDIFPTINILLYLSEMADIIFNNESEEIYINYIF